LFDDYKKQRLLDALKKTNGNKSAAARLLEISNPHSHHSGTTETLLVFFLQTAGKSSR